MEGDQAWLEAYVKNGSHKASGDATPDKINWDGYPASIGKRIKRDDPKTLDDFLKKLGGEVRGWLGPYCEKGYVCRHNAHTAVNLLKRFKDSGDFPVLDNVKSIEPWRADNPDKSAGGHRWVRVETKDGVVYHFDPMNQIILKIERSSAAAPDPYTCPCPCPYTLRRARKLSRTGNVYGHGHGHVYVRN